ncbi:MAG: CoA transferase [Dehalococcoidia bacterium]
MSAESVLAGVTVVDLSQYVAGPYCTQLLGALGADVIKVEPIDSGDAYRRQGPQFLAGEATLFLALNSNKRSIALDFRTDRGHEIMRRLIQRADVMVENSRPGVFARVGLDYDSACAINPRIVYASISGYGQTGPAATRGAFDVVLQGVGGLMSVTGEADGRPAKVGAPVLDIGSAVLALAGILAALLQRERTNQGQHVDTSLLDFSVASLTTIAASYFASGQVPRRLGSASPSFAPYQAFHTADVDLVIAGSGSEDLWRRFAHAVGLAHLVDDDRFRTNADRVKNQRALTAITEERLAEHPASHWIAVLDAARVPCGPVNDLEALFASPQVAARELVAELEHPRAGTYRSTAVPLRLSASSTKHRSPAPVLGQHTAEVLRSLGYSDDEITSFEDAGVIATATAAAAKRQQ